MKQTVDSVKEGVETGAERPTEAAHSRSRRGKSEGRPPRASPRDSPQAQSSASPASSRTPQAGSSRNPTGNSASTVASTHSGRSRGTDRSTPGSSHQSASSRLPDRSTSSTGSSYQTSSSRSPEVSTHSARSRGTGRSTPRSSHPSVSSRSPDGSTSSAGSSYQTSGSRSPEVSSAQRSNKQGLSSRSLKRTHPISAGEPPSGRSRGTGRSTPASSHPSASSRSPDGSTSSAGSSYQASSSRSPEVSSAQRSKKQGLSSRSLKRTHPRSAGEPPSGRSRGTGRSTPGSSHPSASSRSPDGSTSSAGSSYQASSSRSPEVSSAQRSKKQGLSSRSLKRTHPRSAGEPPSERSRGTGRSTPGSSHPSASSRSPNGSTSSAGSSYQISNSRSPEVSSAKKSNKQGLSSRSLKRTHPRSAGEPPSAPPLKQTHPRSAGVSSSARSTRRSPGQSSEASHRETASKGEDGHSSKFKKRIHHRRRHHGRRKDGHRSEHSSPETSSGSGLPSDLASGPFSLASDNSSSLGSKRLQQQPKIQQQTVPSHRSARTPLLMRGQQQRVWVETMGGGKYHEHRSNSRYPKHRREHRATIKHDLGSDASRQGPGHRKSPLGLQDRILDQDGRKPVPNQQTRSDGSRQGPGHRKSPLGMQDRVLAQDGRKPVLKQQTRPSPSQVPSRTGRAKETEKYENFDEMMRVQRRQSLLSQKIHSGKAKLGIGLPSSNRGKHGQTKSGSRRRYRTQGRSPGSTTDAQSVDSDVFAHPIFNAVFEADPSKSTAAFHRRASVIAALVQNRNWRDGSKLFRPLEFGALNKKVSNVSGDPFLDPSCSLFINNELFESEAPDPTRKHGPVFVALPIPFSGVVLDPREALAEAGWVKSHPNDPVEKGGGIARSRKSDDQVKRALHEVSFPAVAMKRDGQENAVQKRMDQDLAAVSEAGPMQPDHKAWGTFAGTSTSSPPQPPEGDGANQMVMPDLWSQGMEFDPATAWQQQAASVPSEGIPAPPPLPPQGTLQDNQVQPQDNVQDNQLQLGISPDQQFGFQTDQQFGDGTSTVPSFEEQYAGNVQDPGFFPPQDPGFSGPQPPSTAVENQIGILIGGLTFDSYARMNFSAQPTGMWPLSIWKRMKIDVLLMYTKASQHPCAPVSSWQDPLGEPLLRTVPYKFRRKALAVFAHLMAYMGDVPTRQSSTWHIHQILSAGIRYRGLRDEVFCQIIKQTTANPSRLSNTKGWQAMAICCGIFLPSENFYPYLDAHLEQVAGGNIARQGTADQLGQYEHGMVNPSEAAAYSIERLRKVRRIGPRRLLPLAKEIEVVETMDTIPTEVALPDGSWQAFILRPIDTSEEVVEHLVNILGLLEARSYGLYQLEANGVEKLIASNSFILEVQARCDTVASTPQSIQDIRYGVKTMEKLTRLLCGSKEDVPEDNSLATVVLGSEGLGSGGQQFSEGSLKMLLKRKLYLVDVAALPEGSKAVVLAFEYSQAVHDVVSGVHIVSEGDAMMLGAMQLRAELGTSRVETDILAGIDGSKYGPQYCVQGNEGAWKDAIATTLASLPYSEDASSWKQDYIDYVKGRCPLYEACSFFVKPLSNLAMPQEMYLAVSSNGVSFVNANSKESFNFLEYAEIASWGYTPTVFSIIAGSMTISADTQFQTTQGLEISNTIQIYVDLLQGVQQRTVQAQAEDQEKPWDQPLQLLEGTFGSISLASSDEFQTAEMMQPQQPEIRELAQSWDLSFPGQSPPLQAPNFGEQPLTEGQEEQQPWSLPLTEGEEEQQPWSQPPLSAPAEGHQLSLATPGTEQQASSQLPPQPPEEPAERDPKHRKHRKHRDKEQKNRERAEKKHYREQPKQKPQPESATPLILLEEEAQIRPQPDQRFSAIKQLKNEADAQQPSLLHSQVKDESEGSNRKHKKHRKHRKHKKEKQHREHLKEQPEEKSESESATPMTSQEQGAHIKAGKQAARQFSQVGQPWKQAPNPQSPPPQSGQVEDEGETAFGGELW